MSFSAADLVATIQLGGVSTAERDLDRFRGKLNDTDTVASKLGKTGAAAFRGAATSIGVATVAAAAYVTSLFKTGVAYNTLQQTSRAALKTLVGGAEQANAQMDKLDAFAKTSPFSKAVFITAQQQLIGFGMEAKKVIPTLDAMQDAVAATGGSSQQLGELVFVLAQIQAAGKITGQDLIQFGQRGVNAAELIGSQMGKTGAQIKDEISKGTLDADAAIDALVKGMKTKFDGAAANVKGTFTGTLDRIHAASRDIGAALAEPFVSKNGGGLFVTWGNQVADVLRAVEGQVSPVVSILMNRAAPAFANLTQMLDKARVQVKSWDSSRLEQGLQSISNNAPGLAALAGAVLGVNTQLLAGIPIIGRFVPAFGPLPGAIAAAALASPELRRELGNLLGELKPLLPVVVDLGTTMSGVLNAALPVVAGGIRAVTAVAGPLVDMISDIPSPMLATAAAAVLVFTAMRSGAPALQGFVDGIRRIGEQAAVQRALAGMEGNTGRFAGAMGVAGKAATGLGNSLKAAFISNPVGLIILGVSTAAGILTAALSAQGEKTREAKDRMNEYRNTLDKTTGATTQLTRETIAAKYASDDWSGKFKSTGVSANQFTDALIGAGDAADRMRAQLVKTAQNDMLPETLRKASDLSGKLGVSLDTLVAATLGYGDAQDTVNERIKGAGGMAFNLQMRYGELSDRVDTFAGDSQDLVDEFDTQKTAIKGAQDETKRYNDALGESADKMSEAGRSNARLNEALKIARDVTKDATTRLNALKQALDELNGGTKTQTELTRDLNEQALNLADAFAATDDKGNKLAKSLVSSTGVIDTTTRAGINLHDQVSRLNDEMLTAIQVADKEAKARGESGVSMEEATAKAQPYIDKLRQIAKDSGLSTGQVDGLIKTMLATPSVVSFLLTDDGSIDVQKQQLLTLAQKILATPDGSFVVQDGNSIKGIEGQLEAMGFKIKHLPDGKVQVTASGVATVEQALTNLARNRRMTITAEYHYANGPGGSGGLTKAAGGPIFGPGTGTSDDVPAMLSNGEHVVTAREVQAAGGHAGMFRIRQALLNGGLAGLTSRFAEGGPVYPVRDTGDRVLRLASTPPAVPAVASAPSPLDLVQAFVAALSGLPIEVRGEVGADGVIRLIDGRISGRRKSPESWRSDLPLI